MRLAVISDIHSNIEALTAVMDDVSGQSVDDIVCLGDNIGYGADPEAVINCLKRYCVTSVLGNHELALMDAQYLNSFNPSARKALLINKKSLSEKSRHYISTLKLFFVQYGCRFVHGVPPDLPSTYVSRESDQTLVHIMTFLSERISFVGHTHQLGIYELDRDVLKRRPVIKQTIFLAKENRYIINTGSVGQPRDGSNKAGYVIWDADVDTLAPRFVAYDYHRAAEKIRKAGIPGFYADLLGK